MTTTEKATPETATAKTVTPETATPDAATPETPATDTAAPDTAAAETTTPEPAAPDAAAPETAAPGGTDAKAAATRTTPTKTTPTKATAAKKAATKKPATAKATPAKATPATTVATKTTAAEAAAAETTPAETAPVKAAATKAAAAKAAASTATIGTATDTAAPATAAPETATTITAPAVVQTEKQAAKPAAQPTAVEPATPKVGGRRMAPLLMMLAVAVGAGLPLYENRIFYYWDDSAAAATAVWRRMGEAVLNGRLPLLELDMWRGGNFAAEAATGIWNPIVLALAAATHGIDNMALALSVVKGFFLVMTALGVYLLAREYGAKPWPAAGVSTAVPLAGYTLFMDSVAWINALMVTAFLPYVWWTLRRYVRGGSPIWLVAAGYLCVSTGNPYSLLGVGLCFLAVLVEIWLTGNRRRTVGLVLSGAAILLLSVIVYLPFLLTSKVGFRAGSSTFNDEFLSPSLTDLLGLSSPSLQPWIAVWTYPYFTVPVMFAAWFLLPMLPWLRWPSRTQWRALSGLLVFAVAALLMLLGPSQIWMFRWPLRLLPMVVLPLMVLFAVLVSEGLQRSRARVRLALSVGIVLMGGYLAWADMTQPLLRHAITTLGVLLLVLVAAWLGLSGVRGFAVLAGGTVAVLALQLAWFPGNYNVPAYRFPTSEAALEKRFDARYEGMTVQVATLGKVPPSEVHPGGAYRDMLFGSLYSVANVETPSAYSGVGFTALDNQLCMEYQAATCAAAWPALWKTPEGASAPLADLLRAQTVVVQHNLVDTRNQPAPKGWSQVSMTDQVAVYRRAQPLAFPEGRVSAISGVTVLEDRVLGTHGEVVRFEDAKDGSLTFARLAWPGYSARVGDQDAPVRQGPAGLLVVDLPDGVTEGELFLSWRPPGLELAAGAFAAGMLLTVLLGAAGLLRRRRTATAGPAPDKGTDT